MSVQIERTHGQVSAERIWAEVFGDMPAIGSIPEISETLTEESFRETLLSIKSSLKSDEPQPGNEVIIQLRHRSFIDQKFGQLKDVIIPHIPILEIDELTIAKGEHEGTKVESLSVFCYQRINKDSQVIDALMNFKGPEKTAAHHAEFLQGVASALKNVSELDRKDKESFEIKVAPNGSKVVLARDITHAAMGARMLSPSFVRTLIMKTREVSDNKKFEFVILPISKNSVTCCNAYDNEACIQMAKLSVDPFLVEQEADRLRHVLPLTLEKKNFELDGNETTILSHLIISDKLPLSWKVYPHLSSCAASIHLTDLRGPIPLRGFSSGIFMRDGSNWKGICSGCAKISNSLKVCSNCARVGYCQVECQKRHWTFHRDFCHSNTSKKFYNSIVKPIKMEHDISELKAEKTVPDYEAMIANSIANDAATCCDNGKCGCDDESEEMCSSKTGCCGGNTEKSVDLDDDENPVIPVLKMV